jgi:nucleotide-binding universal stress UspA family protein
MTERILLGVDDSPASEKAADYVAGWASAATVQVRLLHVLPPVPPLRREPAEHAAVGASSPSRQERWEEAAIETARPVLDRLAARLSGGGVAADKIEHGFLHVHPESSAVAGLIDAARDHLCGTIVVGRNTLPWHRELFHRHFADDLVKKAHGFTLWIVE